MKIFNIICGVILVHSCTNPIAKRDSYNLPVNDTNVVIENKTQKIYNEENINLDSVKDKIKLIKIKSNLTDADTLKYVFQLEDVGTEGNEGLAYYFKDSLKKVEFDIYTSMWRYQIQYFFMKDKIDVIENTYNISDGYSSKSEIVKEITYTIDLNGKLIGDADKDRIDVFHEFEKVVPFKLK